MTDDERRAVGRLVERLLDAQATHPNLTWTLLPDDTPPRPDRLVPGPGRLMVRLSLTTGDRVFGYRLLVDVYQLAVAEFDLAAAVVADALRQLVGTAAGWRPLDPATQE